MPIIQAVDRALQIIDLFNEQDSEWKLSDISNRLGLHKSTVFSLLKTLQMHGYIDQNPENGKYKLGLKLFERGNLVIRGLDIQKIAKNYLFDLSVKTGQTTHLVILDGKEGVYIDKVEGSMAIVRYSRIGKRIPIHCSAVGKVLIAFKDQEDIRKMLTHYHFEGRTPNTITDHERFLLELGKVHHQGFSIDNEENEKGVRSAAVPIMDHTGEVVAAVSLSTLIPRVDDGQFSRFIAMLKEAGEQMSKRMGDLAFSFQDKKDII